MSKLTIVMYHYVRPIKNSEFPNIKGLEFDSFIKQLDYLQENFSVVTNDDVISSVKHKSKLPENACWLTFDDGYKDHHEYVLPELVRRNIVGAFFPPKVAIKDSKMLNVNSIHHILACCNNFDDLMFKLKNLSISFGMSQRELDNFFLKYAVSNRFDNSSTIFVKRMLQDVLPENIRNKITSLLFKEYVGTSQSDFAKKLYMNKEEISNLIKNNMFVGSHGSMHYRLDQISEEEQRNDLNQSLEFLEEIGAQVSDWVMCYPYGAYNDKTISIVKELGAIMGITTEARDAFIGKDNPLTLPRLDTNDFPQ